MTVNYRIYRDPETGKIWEHIGGQEPREISEDYLRRINMDINSIPVLNREKKKKVICPNCGNAVIESPFCSECGTKLDKVTCPKCGSVVRKTPFCPECGAKLADQ